MYLRVACMVHQKGGNTATNICFWALCPAYPYAFLMWDKDKERKAEKKQGSSYPEHQSDRLNV